MLKNIILVILCIAVILLLGIPEYLCRKVYPYKSTAILTITTVLPKSGTILRYENFRSYKVPIKSDGVGGEYRYIGDVPWDMFTIEEKFDMARVGGGYLNEVDIEQIRQKYTKK